MAADAFTLSSGEPFDGVHNTLTSTTADTITITCLGESYRVEVFNRSTTQALWVELTDTAVASADGTLYVPTSSSVSWRMGPGVSVVSVVGNANDYSVHAVPQSAW